MYVRAYVFFYKKPLVLIVQVLYNAIKRSTRFVQQGGMEHETNICQ